MNKRSRILKNFSKNKSLFNWEKYRVQRNLVVSLIRKAKLDYDYKTNEMLSNPNTSPKKWWNLVKYFKVLRLRFLYHLCMRVTGIFFYPKEKVDIFNEFFVSQTYLPT